jgi:DNA-binding protein HU-beta
MLDCQSSGARGDGAQERQLPVRGDIHMPVGRQELIKRVATKSNKSVKESTVFVNAVLETIREALEAEDAVTLVGFGKFSVKETAPSVRVNPQTREKINVPARKKVKFSAGKELDEAVRNAKHHHAAKAAPAKTANK